MPRAVVRALLACGATFVAALPEQALIPEQVSCSTGCMAAASWETRVQLAITAAQSRSVRNRKNVRDPRKRESAHRTTCRGLQCVFLDHGGRFVIPRLAAELNYTGASAEVGVYAGEFSREIMNMWPQGRRHLLVDPYLHYTEHCLSKMENRGTTGENGKQRRNSSVQISWKPDKQCFVSQQAFDRLYNRTALWIGRKHRARGMMQRNMSVAAAVQLPHRSLDFVYLDARHDYEGVLEDLQAWWPRLCEGGLFAGHDFQSAFAVALAVPDWMRSMAAHTAGAPQAKLYVTADHPSSWFMFKPPRLCAEKSARSDFRDPQTFDIL